MILIVNKLVATKLSKEVRE